ncbi:HalOD1 output domain-containing protein [Haladaptatus litoreus]|uniref:HalOD1 output domain-containing protein n=1 Tax=Haladaptatus litoreus TaxID=553468 RepID=UPI001C37D826
MTVRVRSAHRVCLSSFRKAHARDTDCDIRIPPPQSFENPPLSLEITEAIIDHTDRTRDELPPLYEVIDPDALENVFSPRLNGAARANG